MNIFDNFKRAKILVVGDLMLDRYCWGRVSRISPEAPVPVVSLDKTTLVAGGAANVAANIAGLGASATLISIIGDDEESKLVADVLNQAGIKNTFLLPIAGRKTTLKTRIVANQQQVVRLDNETTADIDRDDSTALLEAIAVRIDDADLVVVSDYAKGVLTAFVLERLIALASERKKPIVIDPKGKDYSVYRAATVLTPNEREAADACGLEDRTIGRLEDSCSKMLKDLELQALIVTRGEKGMMLLRSGSPAAHLPATARNVYDVTGAGDTVIATLAVAMASGLDYERAAQLANLAAGLVVEKVGTSAVSMDALREYLAETPLSETADAV